LLGFWMHRAMDRFHPDVQFAAFSLPTYDYLLADGCPNLAVLEARCQETARKLCASPSLPGSIVLLHEKPFDVDAELAPLIAEMLLPPILAGITERGLPMGLIRPIARGRKIDRFLMLKRIPGAPVPAGPA
jgi:peptidoglycan-N-acetylglucosamine deacetylase